MGYLHTPKPSVRETTNAIKCHPVLLCKAEDLHFECGSTVPGIALKPFRMSCSLLSKQVNSNVNKSKCAVPLLLYAISRYDNT